MSILTTLPLLGCEAVATAACANQRGFAMYFEGPVAGMQGEETDSLVWTDGMYVDTNRAEQNSAMYF